MNSELLIQSTNSVVWAANQGQKDGLSDEQWGMVVPISSIIGILNLYSKNIIVQQNLRT